MTHINLRLFDEPMALYYELSILIKVIKKIPLREAS